MNRVVRPSVPVLLMFMVLFLGQLSVASGQSVGTMEVRHQGNERFYVPTQVTQDTPIAISASYGWKGNSKDGSELYVLAGDCRIVQGTDEVRGPRAVVWLQRKKTDPNLDCNTVQVYLEKENANIPLQIALNSIFVEAHQTEFAWFGTFRSRGEIDLHIQEPGSNQLNPEEVSRRAIQFRQKSVSVQQGAMSIPLTSRLTQDPISALPGKTGNEQVRRLRIQSRHETEMTMSLQTDPNNPDKRLCILNNGVTIVIEMNGEQNSGEELGIIDISADRAVIWAAGIGQLSTERESLQDANLDLELYLEGDIVFRAGEKIIYAKKMYYDAKNHIGMIRDTEMVIPIANTVGGFFRVKADSVEQTGPNSLTAKNTWVSTSTMGAPSYRLQSNQLRGEMRKTPIYDPITQQPMLDPQTGKPMTKNEQFLIAENNFVAIDSVPVFYWPWMAMETKDQTLYLRSLKVGHDSIFGYQARTTWNPYQLLNMSKYRPENTDWDLNLDYLSDRGLGHGMSFLYDRETLFGCDTRAIGMMNFYGISDSGVDNLGFMRRSVSFPESYRYRGIWKHRQVLDLPRCFGSFSEDWVLTGQLGTSSDRNYLAQYFEDEWYRNPNPETSLELKKTVNNWSFGVGASYRMDEFYTQTTSLPRLDHYWLGQPLWSNKLIWYEHTKVGYSQFRSTDSPYATEDKDLFRYLDWELDPYSGSNSPYSKDTRTLSRDSVNFSTRHELDIPLALGPLKVVPYGLGEYSFWGEGSTEKNINRLYGRGGVRMNLPLWKVDSDVTSNTWYLNGLAHKTNFVLDASYSSTNKGFEELVLYEQLDDWQIEEFRRRYSVTTFGSSSTLTGFQDSIPVRFDERYYAIRQGKLAGSVTSPSTEIADDLSLLRFEWQNRWQTKRGPVGKRHTIDWITLNTGVNFYPKKEENFGENVGFLDYDFRWHVGDRFSVLSSGLYDVFDTGQKITRVGLLAKRPWLGNIYLGVDRLGGPLNNTYLNAALNYRMSEKWALAFNTSYDLQENENVGQEVGISRIGESFVFTLTGTVNTSKDNWGLSLNVIPVFLLNPKKVEDGILDVRNL